jgi:choline dehydrogenase-like flavoprotein
LGNDHDQVGRYLMNHPKSYCGSIHLKQPIRELPAYFGFHYEGYRGYAGLRVKESLQDEQAILNSYVRFEPIYEWSDNAAVGSFIALQKELRFGLQIFLRANEGKVVALRDYAETGDDSTLHGARVTHRDYLRLAGNVLRDLPSVYRYSLNRLRRTKDLTVRRVRIRNFMEMEPSPENRVTLGSRRDFHGLPVPVVRHEVSELDRRSILAVHAALRRDLAQSSWGQLESDLALDTDPWPISEDASHHIGTTRMGIDPRTSVVDADCRLHGSPNVFAAGSSVFPTSGNANPTFTIVALAIRLAGHLKAGIST